MKGLISPVSSVTPVVKAFRCVLQDNRFSPLQSDLEPLPSSLII
jgi:hypothetical protein